MLYYNLYGMPLIEIFSDYSISLSYEAIQFFN